MSSFVVVGFFALHSGHRVRTPITRADGATTAIWHVHYAMALNCQQPPSLPAELRNYSPVNDVVLPDDTVAFVLAKKLTGGHHSCHIQYRATTDIHRDP